MRVHFSKRMLLWLVLGGVAIPLPSLARDDAGPQALEPATRQLLELAASRRVDELASELEKIRNRDDWTPVQRERVLYGFVMGVRGLPARRVPLSLLATLTDHDSQVLVAHPESRGALMLPRFDIAGAAAGSIEHAKRRMQVAELAGRLSEAPADFWSDAANGQPGALAPGVQTEIVSRVGKDTLSAGQVALVKAWRDDSRLTPAMVVTALRLADGVMAEAVLARETGVHALQLVKRLPEAFPDGEAAALLMEASRRPALASAAVMGLGRLAPRLPAARDWLVEQLDDAGHGASAAAALARLGEPAIIDKTARSLAPSKTEAGLRNRLLMLHLSATPAARRALSAFADDPAMPAGLRREVRQWQ